MTVTGTNSATATATPPVAAVFAILTKVGIYVILRLSLLVFGASAGASVVVHKFPLKSDVTIEFPTL